MSITLDPQIATGLRQWRHHLHKHPELPFQEHQTAEYIAAHLRGLPGVEVVTGIGGTGVVGTLKRGQGTRVVGLRADMDCLPLTEAASHSYSSVNEGAMHACGHDGHMAMVLGAATALAGSADFDGTVRFIFQPAEEPGQGAQAMIADGLFDRFPVDTLYGLHNMPGIPTGQFHMREGAMLGSEDNFEIRLIGVGGHASMPHTLSDPLVAAAEVILALQTVVARNIPASESAVLSCTEILSDGSRNAVPGEVIIRGDTRSYVNSTREILESRIRQISEGICSAHGITCTVSYTHEFEPTVNHPDCVSIASQAATVVVGADNVETNAAPSMASEDFGYFAREVPSCFAFLGNGTVPGQGGTPPHSALYDFNDDILELGVAYYLEVVRSSFASPN
jgi:amidohydrolase